MDCVSPAGLLFSRMSVPHYDMAAAWDDQHIAPQLEQEYGFDPSMFGMPGGVNQHQQHGRRQGSAPSAHNTSFASFVPSFSQNMHQPAVNYNMQFVPGHTQEMNITQNNQAFFHQSSTGPSAAQQRIGQFSTQSGMFADSNNHQGQLDTFPSGSTYHQYSQQGVDVRSGQSTATTSGTHGYDVGAPQAPNSLYSSPNLPISHTFSPELGVSDFSAVQHSASFVGSTQGSQADYSGPSNKRQRLPFDDGNELFEIEQDGDADETQTQGMPSKAKP